MGLNQRNGFTPVGSFQKIKLPWSRLQLPWKRPETHGKLDMDKLEATLNALEERINANSVYLNRTDWGKGDGTRWATIVIAASNSSSLSKETADYVCSGSGDQVTINTAITALLAERTATNPAGRIVFLEGTYNFTAQISVNNLSGRHLIFQGMGAGGYGSSLGGTKFNNTGSGAIFGFAGSSSSSGSSVTIEGIHMVSGGTTAIINAVDMPITVRGCALSSTGSGGCISQTNTTGTSGGTRILDNIIQSSAAGAPCVKVDVGSGLDTPIIVRGNYISGASTSVGVDCRNNISTIPAYGVVNNFIEGCTSTGIGIRLAGNSTEDCMVANNVVRNCGTGIQAAGYRHTITGNTVYNCTTGIGGASALDMQYTQISGNNVESCTTGFVVVAGAVRVTIIGNKAANCTTSYTVAATASNTFIGFNDFGSSGAGTDAGTGTQLPQGLTAGGTINQVLKKNSSADYDASWALDPAIDAITAKGDMLVGSAADTLTVLGAGRDQTIVQSDSSQASGRKNGPAIYVQSTDPSLTYTTAVGDIWIDTT